MNEPKQKIISTLIVTTGAFLGFEALSYIIGIYQLKSSLYVAFYVYAFHVFWLTFLFDLHFKNRGVLAQARLNYKGLAIFWEAFKQRVDYMSRWHYLRHYQNYLVLPGLIYWTTVVLMFLNPFNHELKQVIIISSTVALNVAYWYMKNHISRQLEHQDHWLKVLALVKLYGAFLIYSAVVGVTIHNDFGPGFLFLAVFLSTFLLVYQALFQHRLLNFRILVWVMVMAIVQSFVSYWVFNYWSSEYFTSGLVMLATYNSMWGILHHHLDKTLTKKIAFEYLAMMVLLVSFVFASHNFNQRVI